MHRKLMIALYALTLSLTGLTADDGHHSGDDHGRDGAAQGPNDQTELRTRMAGPAISGVKPTGAADFRTGGGRTRLTVQVEDVNLPDGTGLTVAIIRGGVATKAGTISLAAGFAELELRSQDGDPVPPIQAGDFVAVLQGTTIRLAGVF